MHTQSICLFFISMNEKLLKNLNRHSLLTRNFLFFFRDDCIESKRGKARQGKAKEKENNLRDNGRAIKSKCVQFKFLKFIFKIPFKKRKKGNFSLFGEGVVVALFFASSSFIICNKNEKSFRKKRKFLGNFFLEKKWTQKKKFLF